MLIKQFVQESISHAIRLEQALVKLQTERRIVVLITPQFERRCRGKTLKSTPSWAPVAWKNRSTDSEPPQYSTVTHTTELPTGKLQLAFPFTTFQRLCCIKPESPTASSNCKAPTTREQIKDPPATRRTSHSDHICDPKVEMAIRGVCL